MEIAFHGAAQTVTGSACLITLNGASKKKKILVDFGLFQNGGIIKHNQLPKDIKPEEIEAVVVTHAHVDHTGKLPMLVANPSKSKRFNGNIFSTAPTQDLTEIVINDCNYLMEEEVRKQERKYHETIEPLYTQEHIERIMRRFAPPVNYNETVEIIPRAVKATFFNAGHILGASSVRLEIDDGVQKSLTISGDIGNDGQPFIDNPAFPCASDFVVEECTYGDRNHKPIDLSVEELYSAIRNTFNRSGNVFIPAFAIERTQEVLYFIKKGLESGEIPKTTKVFLDSPMAIDVTNVFNKYPEFYNSYGRQLVSSGYSLFDFENLQFSRTSDDSKAINEIKGGAIIIAGSGMCNGGRIIHHIRHNLGRKECSFIFLNYAPPGSLPRQIIEKKLRAGKETEYVNVFGTDVPIRAQIHTINGFSAHAGQGKLIEWAEHTQNPEKIFLVHGSEKPMQTFAGELKARGFNVEMPELNQKFRV